MTRADSKRYRKVSVLNWMGTLILTAIPGVNIIALILFIIFAKAQSKRSYAIAMLLLMIIGALLSCAAFIVFGDAIATFAEQLRGSAVLNLIPEVPLA